MENNKTNHINNVKNIKSKFKNLLLGLKVFQEIIKKTNIYPSDIIFHYDSVDGRTGLMSIWDHMTITCYEDGVVEMNITRFYDKMIANKYGVDRDEYWRVTDKVPLNIINYLNEIS